MKAYTYIEKGRFELKDKPEPKILDSKDAIVKVTLASICTVWRKLKRLTECLRTGRRESSR